MQAVMPTTAAGPLAGTILNDLAAWLTAEHYAKTMVGQVMAVGRGLSAWMADRSIRADDLRLATLEAFAASYGPGLPGHVIVSMRLPTLQRFLTRSGYITDVPAVGKRTRGPRDTPRTVVSDAVAHELAEWASWQRDLRGISDGCIRYRREWVTPLLSSLPVRDGHVAWASCDVDRLNAFIADRSQGYSASSGTAIVDATRSLMRWALASGRIDHDVSHGILRPRATRATLPQGITPGELALLIAVCDPATVTGIRDRAVISTLARLGLRAGELATMSLDDIDWPSGRLTVVGKGRRRLTLPIPVDVGEVLVAWLRVRSKTGDRSLFVRVRRPHTALTVAGVSDIVAHRAQAAGLGVMHAHRLRHTAATAVITAGGNLTEAQELLGHAGATTTRVYARTDLSSLRALAPVFGRWPS